MAWDANKVLELVPNPVPPEYTYGVFGEEVWDFTQDATDTGGDIQTDFSKIMSVAIDSDASEDAGVDKTTDPTKVSITYGGSGSPTKGSVRILGYRT